MRGVTQSLLQGRSIQFSLKGTSSGGPAEGDNSLQCWASINNLTQGLKRTSHLSFTMPLCLTIPMPQEKGISEPFYCRCRCFGRRGSHTCPARHPSDCYAPYWSGLPCAVALVPLCTPLTQSGASSTPTTEADVFAQRGHCSRH